MQICFWRQSPGWGAGLLALLVLAGPARPAPSDAAVRQAWQVLNRWFEAVGGPWRIQRLESMDVDGQMIYGPDGPTLPFHLRATADGRYRYDYQLGAAGKYTQAFDGMNAWQENKILGFGALDRRQHREDLAGADFFKFYRVQSAYAVIESLPDEKSADQTLQVVRLTTGAGLVDRWYFDSVTGLRVRAEEDAAAGPVVVSYFDFRPVDGMTEPFRRVRMQGGKRMEVIARHLIYNAEPDPELFAAPEGLVEDDKRINDLLRRNRDSIGYEALHRIATRVTQSVTEVTTSGMKIAQTMSQKQPNLILTVQDVPGMGRSWNGYNGKIGWVWSELEGYRTMKGAELAQLMGSADLDGPLRLSARCPMRHLLEEKVEDGRVLQGVELASLQGIAGDFYFDTATGYLVRAESTVVAGASGQLKVRMDFSDFRRVDGVMLPFVTIMTNPAMRSVTTIQSVEQNVPLDNAIFEPKKSD